MGEEALRIPDHPTDIRRMLDARRTRLAAGQPVLAATLTQVRKRCGQPTCHCYHSEPHLAWHLTYKVQGKTRTVSGPLDLLDEARVRFGDTVRFKIGGTPVVGKVQEDRGPIGLNGRHLYGVHYELGEGNWYTTELPAEQIEIIEPEKKPG